jgi:hypothetical protein
MNNQLFEEIISEAIKIKLPFLVMMFHSSELMPGCSKYRMSKESIEKLYDTLDKLFIFLNKNQITAVSLTEAAKSRRI